jgi:hypothetical protein
LWESDKKILSLGWGDQEQLTVVAEDGAFLALVMLD